MSYFSEFLRQETPAPKKVMPGYYRKALIVSEVVLTVFRSSTAAGNGSPPCFAR